MVDDDLFVCVVIVYLAKQMINDKNLLFMAIDGLAAIYI